MDRWQAKGRDASEIPATRLEGIRRRLYALQA